MAGNPIVAWVAAIPTSLISVFLYTGGWIGYVQVEYMFRQFCTCIMYPG